MAGNRSLRARTLALHGSCLGWQSARWLLAWHVGPVAGLGFGLCYWLGMGWQGLGIRRDAKGFAGLRRLLGREGGALSIKVGDLVWRVRRIENGMVVANGWVGKKQKL